MNQQPLHLKLTTQVNVHKHPFVHITVTCFFYFWLLFSVSLQQMLKLKDTMGETEATQSDETQRKPKGP